jgi:hypothetical protein
MNTYQKILKSVTKQAESNYCMGIKLKYNDKLYPGIPFNDPIHLKYLDEMSRTYADIRKQIKKNYKTIPALIQYRNETLEDNKVKYLQLFGEDYKYRFK